MRQIFLSYKQTRSQKRINRLLDKIDVATICGDCGQTNEFCCGFIFVDFLFYFTSFFFCAWWWDFCLYLALLYVYIYIIYKKDNHCNTTHDNIWICLFTILMLFWFFVIGVNCSKYYLLLNLCCIKINNGCIIFCCLFIYFKQMVFLCYYMYKQIFRCRSITSDV